MVAPLTSTSFGSEIITFNSVPIQTLKNTPYCFTKLKNSSEFSVQNYENYHAISQFQSFLSIFINFYCSIFAKGAILIDLSRINYGFYLKCFAKVEFQFVYWQRRTCMRYEPKCVLLLQITTFNTGCKKKSRYNSVNVLFLCQHFNDMFTHFEVLFFVAYDAL